MTIEELVYEVYDFNELREKLNNGANATLDAIESKGLEEEFINLLNEIVMVDAQNGKPMTLNELDDFIDYDADFFENQLGVKFWED